jgi:hypothetical protein
MQPAALTRPAYFFSFKSDVAMSFSVSVPSESAGMVKSGRPTWSPEQPLDMHLSLTELVPRISETFSLEGALPGPMILACLQTITSRVDARERWLAMFNSPLGIALAAPGRDLNTTLNWVLAALPPARS